MEEVVSRFVEKSEEVLGAVRTLVPGSQEGGDEEVVVLGGRRVSAAQLQNYFVLQQKNDAATATDNLNVLVELLDDEDRSRS